jgi:flagellar motor switch protein FliN/FliY
LKIGTTRFKLIDIKNIETGDIVVFDNSDTHHMILNFKDFEKDVKLNPNLGLVIPFDNEEGESKMTENIWDSIEVEMNAQFDTVKISLGELKNIEEGLVVDLTSIYDNKVTLSVEDKPIARGELVIVNDRYGVKIDEVITGQTQKTVTDGDETVQNDEFSQNDEFEDIQNEENSEQPMDENPVGDENNEEDEFDYSDFELEDEDI